MEAQSQKDFQNFSVENISEPERQHYSHARKALTSHSIHGSIARSCLLESCYFCADLATIDDEISTAYEHIHDLIQRREQIIKKPTHEPLIPRLPVEVLSLIFIFVKHAYDDEEAYDFSSGEPCLTLPRCSPPLLIGAVCRKWRAISLGTPQLWTDIKVDLMKPEEAQIDMVNEWARRSGALSLNPTIFVEETHCDEIYNDVVPALRSLANRWNNVALQVPWSFAHELLDDLEVTPSITSFHIFVIEDDEDDVTEVYDPIKLQRPFNPKYLYCWNVPIKEIPFQFDNLVHLEFGPPPIEGFLDLIHQAPNLRYCVAQGYLRGDPPTAQITHRSLTHFQTSVKILQHLTLPSLQHLHCYATEPPRQFSSLAEFISRSRPRLQTFILWSEVLAGDTLPSFERLPEITSLTVYYYAPPTPNPAQHLVRIDPFLHSLVQPSTEVVLPRLRELDIGSPSMPSSSWSLIGRLFAKDTQSDNPHVKETKASAILGRPLSKVHISISKYSEMDEDTFMHLLAVRSSGVDLVFTSEGKDLFREMAGRYKVGL